MLQDAFTAFERARMPVLAAIQGGCIGGAVDLVTACDLRYASADAFFCVQEINIGMTADVGTLQRLPKLIPDGIAREMAYPGTRLPAARAYEVGLVNEVFADHESLVDGRHGHRRTRSPARARWPSGGSKEMLNFARDHSVADSLNYIATWQTGMFQPQDMVESFVGQGREARSRLRGPAAQPEGVLDSSRGYRRALARSNRASTPPRTNDSTKSTMSKRSRHSVMRPSWTTNVPHTQNAPRARGRR